MFRTVDDMSLPHHYYSSATEAYVHIHLEELRQAAAQRSRIREAETNSPGRRRRWRHHQ